MTIRGRGPQVMLEGYARTVARGAAGRTMRENIAAMDALVIAGLAPDGNTVDGSSRTGGTPYDAVVAQFPRETLSAWAIPAPLLDIGDGFSNVVDFGADPTGVADSSPAINNALAAGKIVWAPRGTYHLRSPLNVGPSTTLYGDGRGQTVFTVWDDFSHTGSGVIVLTGAEEASPTVARFSINFTQPWDQGSRANFKTLANGGTSSPGGTGVMYPPAIYSNSSNRPKIRDLQIYGAWDGINTGPTCACWIEDVEVGALNVGLRIDQSRDFAHVRGYHFWPFGIPSTQPIWNVFTDGNAFAARFGEGGGVNGGNIVDFNSLYGRVYIDNSNTWLHFANIMMDVAATFEVNRCSWIQVSNMYCGTPPPTSGNTNSPVQIGGGFCQFTNCFFGSARVCITQTAGALHISSSQIGSNGFPDKSAIIQTGGQLFIESCLLAVSDVTFGAWTVPIVQSLAGTIHFTANRFAPRGPTAGTVQGLYIQTDNVANYVADNNWNSWLFTPPAGNLGCYGLNSDGAMNRTLRVNGNYVGAGFVSGASLIVNAAAGTQRNMEWQSGGVLRWNLAASNAAESGGNVGSDLDFFKFADDGSPNGTPLTISRATGVADFAVRPTVAGIPVTLAIALPVSGAHGDNPALVSLLDALASAGLITNETTA